MINTGKTTGLKLYRKDRVTLADKTEFVYIKNAGEQLKTIKVPTADIVNWDAKCAWELDKCMLYIWIEIDEYCNNEYRAYLCDYSAVYDDNDVRNTYVEYSLSQVYDTLVHKYYGKDAMVLNGYSDGLTAKVSANCKPLNFEELTQDDLKNL